MQIVTNIQGALTARQEVLPLKLTGYVHSCISEGSNGHSDSPQIFNLLWNPKDHYRNHSRSQLISILRQISSVDAHISYFFQIQLNIILPSMLSLPSDRFTSGFLFSFCMYFFTLAIRLFTKGDLPLWKSIFDDMWQYCTQNFLELQVNCA
jgi:hypothetical protein